MPSSLEISQTRYTVPGLRRVGGRAPARHAGAPPLTPVLRHTTSSASGAGRRIVPRATVPPPLRQHRQSLASLAAPDGLAAAAAARPPQARPHAHAPRERPRGVPSRGADSTPPPAVARDRGARSRTATSSSSSAASSTSAARSGPRKWPPQCVWRGRRDQLGDIHLGDRRRAQRARTTSPSADEPTRSARARVDAPTAAACCANRGKRVGARRHVVDGRPSLTERSAGRRRRPVHRGDGRRADARPVGRPPTSVGTHSPGDSSVRRRRPDAT